jgi:hypothetical protein
MKKGEVVAGIICLVIGALIFSTYQYFGGISSNISVIFVPIILGLGLALFGFMLLYVGLVDFSGVSESAEYMQNIDLGSLEKMSKRMVAEPGVPLPGSTVNIEGNSEEKYAISKIRDLTRMHDTGSFMEKPLERDITKSEIRSVLQVNADPLEVSIERLVRGKQKKETAGEKMNIAAIKIEDLRTGIPPSVKHAGPISVEEIKKSDSGPTRPKIAEQHEVSPAIPDITPVKPMQKGVETKTLEQKIEEARIEMKRTGSTVAVPSSGDIKKPDVSPVIQIKEYPEQIGIAQSAPRSGIKEPEAAKEPERIGREEAPQGRIGIPDAREISPKIVGTSMEPPGTVDASPAIDHEMEHTLQLSEALGDLEKLGELRNKGILTEKEFNELKNKILSKTI